jgi:hypothetical protein
MAEGLGWLATALFSASYFVAGRRMMLAVQIGAALLWVGYGLLTRAAPVVVANGIVVLAALSAVVRQPRSVARSPGTVGSRSSARGPTPGSSPPTP